MENIIEQIKKETEELNFLIKQFDKKMLIPLVVFVLKLDRLTPDRYLRLLSAVKQIGYLLSLCLTSKGTKIISSDDFHEIIDRLQRIENLYKQLQAGTGELIYYSEDYRQEAVTSCSYGNWFFNADLVYFEQLIDKIEKTFEPMGKVIQENFQLTIADFILFFHETNSLCINKFEAIADKFINHQNNTNDGILFYNEEGVKKVLPLGLAALLMMNIDDYTHSDKAEKILNLLSISDLSEDKIGYYGEKQELECKPFIRVSDTGYILFHNSQLLVAIYELLLGLFTTSKNNKRSLLRKNFLEKKTKEVFEKLFNNECKVYVNYYIKGSDNEKDLLVLYNDCAFVIECKSDKMTEPFRNRGQGYIRLKRDFGSSIQKGYEQALEVENAFYSLPIIDICDKNRNKVDEVLSNKYRHVFNIIITQERYGLIQIDLGLLLKKEENAIYPWSVCIDDLETMLLTIKRKKEKLSCLVNYLISREKLNERVICHDELDLAANYLMLKADFIRICSKREVLITQPDVCLFFDDLYNHGGIGFDNEFNVESKFYISVKGYVIYELCRKIQLQEPEVIAQYKAKNHIETNKSMKFLGERIIAKPTEMNKRFMRAFQRKAVRWDYFIDSYYQFIKQDRDISDLIN